jgi:hypothetical protein
MTIVECAKCHAMFRDTESMCGVCPHCGHDNGPDDDDFYGGYEYLSKARQ